MRILLQPGVRDGLELSHFRVEIGFIASDVGRGGEFAQRHLDLINGVARKDVALRVENFAHVLSHLVCMPDLARENPVEIHCVKENQVLSTSMKASWGMLTLPKAFMRFLPSFCFSRSLRLRVMSPP